MNPILKITVPPSTRFVTPDWSHEYLSRVFDCSGDVPERIFDWFRRYFPGVARERLCLTREDDGWLLTDDDVFEFFLPSPPYVRSDAHKYLAVPEDAFGKKIDAPQHFKDYYHEIAQVKTDSLVVHVYDEEAVELFSWRRI
jgi:hypothetical protein